MSIVIGFIFTGFYSFRPRTIYDRMKKRKFDLRDLNDLKDIIIKNKIIKKDNIEIK